MTPASKGVLLNLSAGWKPLLNTTELFYSGHK